MEDLKREFNSHTPKSIDPKQTFTHEQTKERIDNYSRTAEQEQFAFLQRMKNKYVGEHDKRQENRAKADIHYAMGRNIGLNQASPERINEDREISDQKLRRDTLDQAKTYYHESHSLSKNYNQQNKENGKSRSH